MVKDREQKTFWNIILAAIGITATGLYLGLRRLLWRLWAVLSGLWIIVWLLLGSSHQMSTDLRTPVLHESWYWVIVLGPPLLLLLVAALLDWIISGLREDVAESRAGSDRDEVIRAERRKLGYDE